MHVFGGDTNIVTSAEKEEDILIIFPKENWQDELIADLINKVKYKSKADKLIQNYQYETMKQYFYGDNSVS